MALTKTPVCDFGKKAEDFKLKSINNEIVNLKDIKGEKATVIGVFSKEGETDLLDQKSKHNTKHLNINP